MEADQTDKSLGLALAKVAILDEKRSINAEHLNQDEYIPNSENVTQHEFETLRHVGDTLPYAAWLVVVVEFAER
jgi:proton-dependent oligopeptide transporter, POT family